MKQLTKPYKFTGTNGWGAQSTSTRQAFEVEPADVNTKMPNYLGYNHRVYTFKSDDIGRIVEHIAPPVPSWSFASKEWVINALKAQLANTADHTTKACLESELERIGGAQPQITKRLSWRTKADQFYQSGGCGQTHTIKFMGTCEGCGRSVYSHGCAGEKPCGDLVADSPDPRGAIPPAHCMNLYHAREHGMIGRDIVTCYDCAQDGDKYRGIMAAAKSTGTWTPAEQNNCDGSGPHSLGDVRVMPTGGDGNMILCLRCWLKENSYRIERNRDLADFAKFDIIEWQNAKVYGGDDDGR